MKILNCCDLKKDLKRHFFSMNYNSIYGHLIVQFNTSIKIKKIVINICTKISKKLQDFINKNGF